MCLGPVCRPAAEEIPERDAAHARARDLCGHLSGGLCRPGPDVRRHPEGRAGIPAEALHLRHSADDPGVYDQRRLGSDPRSHQQLGDGDQRRLLDLHDLPLLRCPDPDLRVLDLAAEECACGPLLQAAFLGRRVCVLRTERKVADAGAEHPVRIQKSADRLYERRPRRRRRRQRTHRSGARAESDRLSEGHRDRQLHAAQQERAADVLCDRRPGGRQPGPVAEASGEVPHAEEHRIVCVLRGCGGRAAACKRAERRDPRSPRQRGALRHLPVSLRRGAPDL